VNAILERSYGMGLCINTMRLKGRFRSQWGGFSSSKYVLDSSVLQLSLCVSAFAWVSWLGMVMVDMDMRIWNQGYAKDNGAHRVAMLSPAR
jgi:hypothetical protein